jgi:hypothetical protein
MANFLILDEGHDEEKDIYFVNCLYGQAGNPLKVVFTDPALTYLKKEITPRIHNLVGRAIDTAELLIWENEEVVLVEMGGAIIYEMMTQFRQAK